MSRKKELSQVLDGLYPSAKIIASRVVEEMLYLEAQMTETKKFPPRICNPKNPLQQRPTVAYRQYKEYLQQYTNCVKIMAKLVGAEAMEEASPLRSFLRHMQESEDLRQAPAGKYQESKRKNAAGMLPESSGSEVQT